MLKIKIVIISIIIFSGLIVKDSFAVITDFEGGSIAWNRFLMDETGGYIIGPDDRTYLYRDEFGVGITTPKNYLIEYYQDSSLNNLVSLNVDTETELLIFNSPNSSNEVIYILLKYFEPETNTVEQLCLSYSIVKEINITSFANHSKIQALKSLNVNSSYLQGQLNIPANTSITFYEKENSQGYTERYGFFQTPTAEYLLLDSFYPNRLESTLQPRIVTKLNERMAQLAAN